MKSTVHSLLLSLRNQNRKGLALLADPDKASEAEMRWISEAANDKVVDLLFAGGSLVSAGDMHSFVHRLRETSSKPIVLFPGNLTQITSEADAVLFLSLISGRNPELLIGQHVAAAPMLRRSGIEVIPTGYMLIDGGRITTAHYVSNTLPIPADKPEIAAVTAMAGEMLGLRVIYLDCGSGAAKTVSPQMVEAVRNATTIPLIVGGGIRSRQDASDLLAAGADLIVVGTALEKPGTREVLADIASAVTSF